MNISTPPSRWAPAWQFFEAALLFVLLPLRLALWPPRGAIFPLLWVATAYCLMRLLRDPTFPRANLWQIDGWRRVWPGVLLRAALAAVLLTAVTCWLAPQRLLAFPRTRPGVYALVMVLYPVLSAYPQGLIYRGFFAQRYRAWFRSETALLLASAAAFSFAHVVLLNWVAPVFTFVGGLLFMHTYLRTRSLVLAAAEHALYGNLAFTLGIGWYFYAGARFVGTR